MQHNLLQVCFIGIHKNTSDLIYIHYNTKNAVYLFQGRIYIIHFSHDFYELFQ
ncbi:hypothetical protein CLOBOL_00401 [Enterocloster bolteae ATCC BAA-613]|uniref:Uncharacterized protein n=1 Tax=Enterocloster bolteae (strain ATCC BAA-613 / DSM 15670 / CCUG 46953 / JCM 12243 / WAL 16351) TaxID=411902 RepID=A8RHF6_ENTBW|nr:hypothetical protein CLOBOL_00401 [Enterocloster bolteae ATCC BAA-613]